MKKAVVLLSGGLDSTTALYIAKQMGYCCECLIIDYGQRHSREIESAKKIARRTGCAHRVARLDLAHAGSALLDKKIKLPQIKILDLDLGKAQRGIPASYVPARNIIFLAMAASVAEALGARDIFIGAHTQDFSGYPDCRPVFLKAMERALGIGTAGGRFTIHAPLISKSKAGIIKMAFRLGVPLELTWSCYQGGKRPCGKCDSCRYRAKGFKEAGIADPYRPLGSICGHIDPRGLYGR